MANNYALYSLFGNVNGGAGERTFAVLYHNGRVIESQGHTLIGGSEAMTLHGQSMPNHSHPI